MIESPDGKQTNPYAALRINDWYEKLRCALVLDNVIKELPCPSRGILWNIKAGDILSDKYEPLANYFVNNGMTRAQGFFEVKIKLQSNVLFLIQIQGNQYRRGIERNGTFEENRKWLDDKATPISKFFNHAGELQFPYSEALKNDKDGVLVMGPKRKSLDGFCRYGNWFLYQYADIHDHLPVRNVIAAVVEDINKVIELKNKFFLIGTRVADEDRNFAVKQ